MLGFLLATLTVCVSGATIRPGTQPLPIGNVANSPMPNAGDSQSLLWSQAKGRTVDHNMAMQHVICTYHVNGQPVYKSYDQKWFSGVTQHARRNTTRGFGHMWYSKTSTT